MKDLKGNLETMNIKSEVLIPFPHKKEPLHQISMPDIFIITLQPIKEPTPLTGDMNTLDLQPNNLGYQPAEDTIPWFQKRRFTLQNLKVRITSKTHK